MWFGHTTNKQTATKQKSKHKKHCQSLESKPGPIAPQSDA